LYTYYVHFCVINAFWVSETFAKVLYICLSWARDTTGEKLFFFGWNNNSDVC